MPSPEAGSVDLEAEAVVKRYGSTRALEGVSLTVGRGECVALVGESGSGKTTLLRMFNRTVTPDEGTVRWRGRDLSDLDPVTVRRETGFVQQEGGLLPHWTVLRNATLVPWLRGRPDAVDRGRAALERVGLPPDDFARRWPRALSGGQRQRVALARALADDPEVLLLDEPFGALDAITRTELQDLFAGLVDRLGVTVLLVTHDLHEAMRLADRIAVLREGRVEQVADPASLRSAPSGAYVADLLSRSRVSDVREIPP